MRHRLNFSTTDYIRTLVLGITLLPFRLFGLLACFVAAWAVASVGQVGADLSRPLAGWQALARRLVAILGRLSMVFCGIHWVQVDLLDLIQPPACVSGGGETMLQRRGACSRCCSSQVISLNPPSSPQSTLHSSFFDAIVIFCSGFPIFVNREENRAYPWIGRCMEFSQSIFVSREVKCEISINFIVRFI